MELVEVQNYIDKCINNFKECGIELIKSDFLYANHFNQKYKNSNIPDNLLKQLLAKIKNHGFYSIACGSPIIPAIGTADAIRVSDDLNFPILNSIWPLNIVVTNSRIKQLIANVNTRESLKNYVDIDCDIFFTSSKLGMTKKNRDKLENIIQKVEGLKFLGDDLTTINKDQKGVINRFLKH